MEQKAVTYKTIKGMARDMAMSNGSNDYSYENYNIRITTRGKEDSLVVTNEKGTESNIIATRNVQKTVNTIFVGEQPTFKNDSKGETQLSSETDDIYFGVNTEYPVNEETDNELKVKGHFKLTELEPTTWMNEELYLLDNGVFEKDFEFTIPGNYNNHERKVEIKDIVLNQCSTNADEGYYCGSNAYDDVDGINSEYDPFDESTTPLTWMNSYKTLYDKLIERRFNFYPFNTNINNYNFTESSKLEYLNQSIVNNEMQFTLDRKEKGDFYIVNELDEVQITGTDYWKLTTQTSRLGFLNGFVYADKYPIGTSLDLLAQADYTLRLKVTTPVPEEWWTDGQHDNEKVYQGYYNDYAGTIAEIKLLSYYNKDNYKISVGYIEITLKFDINDYFDAGVIEDVKKYADEINTEVSGLSVNDLSCYILYSRYSTSSYSPCFSINVVSNSSNWISDGYGILKKKVGDIWYSITAYGGPFFPYNIRVAGDGSQIIVDGVPQSDYPAEGVPDISIGKLIQFNISSQNDVTTHNFNGIYKFKDFTETFSMNDTSNTSISTSDGIVFYVGGGTTKYSNRRYAIRTSDTTIKPIEYIRSAKDNTDENIYIKFDSVLNEIKYNQLSGIINANSTDYVILKITSSAFATPFIVYLTKSDYDDLVSTSNTGYSNGKGVLTFNNGSFSALSGALDPIVKSDMSAIVAPCEGTSFKIFKDSNSKLFFGSASDKTMIGDNVVIEKVNELPIFRKGTGNTIIDSETRKLYINPTYDKILEVFGFKQEKFSAEISLEGFRLKHSNNDWDGKFIYQMLDSVDDNLDYIKELDPPFYRLDVNKVVLSVLQNESGIFTGFKINVNKSISSYYGDTINCYVTIKDNNSDFSRVVNVTSEEVIIDNDIPENHLASKHDFYISDISSYENEPQGLEKEEIEQDIKYIENETISSEYSMSYEFLKDNNNKRYIRQIIDNKGIITTCTFEYDFVNSYKNKFYSLFDLNILKSDFGDYHALSIPGRVLGSCTIDDYVVLFFHYSSPALKFYKKTGSVYQEVPCNTENVKELYTKRKGEGNNNIYDLAVQNGILLRDDNNDYINGKNKDYIIKLKYIDARPDNKENEWVKIVYKIANAATQVQLTTPITEKKPYYSADILWSGDLGFNANNGIETIGYYESKDVIKVYWTDGKNQPRMINIMTPKELRSGDYCVWDNKTFDFIQEISSVEEYEITKQFGGGAFPAGSVQYYFTYSNLGGCETNPFICSPIYYTSQSSKGNAPTKITDNTFKVVLSNLSNRFDYVNIYSVVRTTKDMQPLCKKVINISIRNKSKVEFTDNNLLGEIVDSSYLLMLQGTPISALTMAEKDNTLFLGNINKLQNGLTSEEKQKIKTYFSVIQKSRLYQDYNPNEEDWYENYIENDKISLEKNSMNIKTFMYNEYYRLGIQLQDKYGRWSDPIFIKDVKCNTPIKNEISYKSEEDDGSVNVSKLKSYIPYFKLKLDNKYYNDFISIINKYEYKRIRPVIVYPNISSRNVLCQGLLSPTMFNYADRSVNGPFNFASYFFRPYPPAISSNTNESGEYLFKADTDIEKAGGYPIEYRHGYPITGYHDIIEESLADGRALADGDSLANIVSDYLSAKTITSVKLTSNTPGWYIGKASYLRDGTITIGTDREIYCTGKIYVVTNKTNRGHLNYEGNVTNKDCGEISENTAFITSDVVSEFVKNMVTLPSGKSKCEAVGFSSHMHYFKTLGYLLASAITADMTGSISASLALVDDSEVIKKISDTECILLSDSIMFNEGNVWYRAYYPITIKIIPLSKVNKKKHRGLKRKTYFSDIVVTSNKIEVSSKANGDKYIDDGGFTSYVAKKAYFALNNGEIQCANGNKKYNIFEGSQIDKVDETYSSSEVNVSARKQSLFYVDESVCTLNSPEIEYNPTIQKIDLSNYKLNIVGSSNITGYKNNIVIDTETPPAAFGTIVGQGFKHEPFEIQNFNTEAYRYMLSGAYWYDSFFKEGDDEEGEKPNDDSKYLSDQYCWWVYPFNRQILNNSREGQYGKLRSKKWVNYHYSAFSDYFGDASIDYNLKDAQQIYDVHQSVNIDTIWQKDKATYFGSCDTAYTNPVPLVGVLGGSNLPEENAFEQSMAVSPHCGFKAGESTYSSANLADIIPFSFASTNHFVLSLDGYKEGIANVFPKYFTDESLLNEVKDISDTNEFEYKYEFETTVNSEVKKFRTSMNPLDFLGYGRYLKIMVLDEFSTGAITTISLNKIFDENNVNVLTEVGFVGIETNTPFNPNLIKIVEENEQSGFVLDENNEIISVNFKKVKEYKDTISIGDIDFDDDIYKEDTKTMTRAYNIPSSLIIDSTKPSSCISRYVHYNIDDNSISRVTNEKVKKNGIYDYGHVYIAQLERGVNSADEVFNGTEESVLLQQTWIPAGEAIDILKFKINGADYVEGDTYYQRYDCMKTYAYTGSDVNQNIEVLSTMIQTRVNLDGVYSVRGTVDNVDMNNTNTNLLNDAYSQDDNYFTYSITNSYISDITEYSNMFTWTLTKQSMSSKDNWMAVNLIAYYNATGSFGKITRIINYRNNLFCFQDNAISQIAYNERVALTPSDGVPIEIGNSGKVQGLNYISSNVGCQNRWSVCPSKGFLYWVDDRRAEIYRFGDSLEPFSTAKGFSDWVKSNTYGEDWKPIKSTNVPITTYYDNNNDDIYFVTEKDCLAYNEKIDAFESFFSYEDSFILNSAGNTIVIKEQDAIIKENSAIYTGDAYWNNGIRGDGLSSIEIMHEGDYNRFFGVQMPFYIRLKVYPTDLQRDKIYTNLELNIDAFDEKDLYLPDETITKVRIWNEYQWGQWKLNDPLYGTTAYKKRFRTHYLQLPRASYYPNGYYENFNNIFYREPMWSVWNNNIDSGNVLSYINAGTVNDRIRNPWTWLEIYKSNGVDLNDFAIATIEGETFADRQQYYFDNKSKLFIERYTFVNKDDWGNYQELYKIVSDEYVKEANDGSDRQPDVIAVGLEIGYLEINVTEETFKELKDSLYIKVEDVYTQEGITDFDENETYYLKEDVRSNYNLSELYYQKQDGTYDNASQDMYDNEDITLYKLTYNELYTLDYINCANIYKFADDVTYYELKKSNCRVEIHDIILKYFEA